MDGSKIRSISHRAAVGMYACIYVCTSFGREIPSVYGIYIYNSRKQVKSIKKQIIFQDKH